jgi:hypothetical protein
MAHIGQRMWMTFEAHSPNPTSAPKEEIFAHTFGHLVKSSHMSRYLLQTECMFFFQLEEILIPKKKKKKKKLSNFDKRSPLFENKPSF